MSRKAFGPFVLTPVRQARVLARCGHREAEAAPENTGCRALPSTRTRPCRLVAGGKEGASTRCPEEVAGDPAGWAHSEALASSC